MIDKKYLKVDNEMLQASLDMMARLKGAEMSEEKCPDKCICGSEGLYGIFPCGCSYNEGKLSTPCRQAHGIAIELKRRLAAWERTCNFIPAELKDVYPGATEGERRNRKKERGK